MTFINALQNLDEYAPGIYHSKYSCDSKIIKNDNNPYYNEYNDPNYLREPKYFERLE